MIWYLGRTPQILLEGHHVGQDFFGNGSPYPIILLLIPGFTISFTDIGMFLPSSVGTLIEQPHNASRKLILAV